MNQVLKIGVPYIGPGKEKGFVRLNADLFLEDRKVYSVWYETDAKYEAYLCTERADGLVVNLLLYAMEHSMDIACSVPLSERLCYQLTEYLIPAVSKYIPRYHPIRIMAETDAAVLPSQGAVGASVSGGVDSFYTLCRHMDRKEQGYNVTTLTFFNAGASGDFGGDEARASYLRRIDWISDVARQMNREMMCVDTNINEFLNQVHIQTHTFRTLAIPLILQKYFSVYLFSSGHEFADFKFTSADPANYDSFILSCISTRNLEFHLSGGEADRLEKMKFISDFPITYNRLNVCVKEDTNCCRCEKCQRTMCGLYAIGKLDRYQEVFDLERFRKDRYKMIARSISRKRTADWKQIHDLMKKNGQIGGKDLCLARLYLCYQTLRNGISRRRKKTGA